MGFSSEPKRPIGASNEPSSSGPCSSTCPLVSSLASAVLLLLLKLPRPNLCLMLISRESSMAICASARRLSASLSASCCTIWFIQQARRNHSLSHSNPRCEFEFKYNLQFVLLRKPDGSAPIGSDQAVASKLHLQTGVNPLICCEIHLQPDQAEIKCLSVATKRKLCLIIATRSRCGGSSTYHSTRVDQDQSRAAHSTV